MDNEKITKATEDAKPKFPRQEPEGANGWTLSYGFLSDLRDEIPNVFEDFVDLETIEAVLLAAEKHL